MRLVGGYRGGNEMLLAMERGEVGGRCGWSWSSVQATRREWIERKQVNLLIQLALSKHPDLPDVPLVVDLAKTDEQRDILRLVFARQQIAYPFLAPPGVPPDRVEVLRAAFLQGHGRSRSFWPMPQRRGSKSSRSPATRCKSWSTELYATPAAGCATRSSDMLK